MAGQRSEAKPRRSVSSITYTTRHGAPTRIAPKPRASTGALPGSAEAVDINPRSVGGF
jgi:hypothetical protein